jgi:ATP-binding cassette subfamily A (ABC1) protein 3
LHWLGIGIQAFDYVTNRMSNMTTTRGLAKEVTTTAKTLSHVSVKHNWKTLPFQMLVIIAFVAAVSIAVIYPSMFSTNLNALLTGQTNARSAYERKSNVRALHYSNGVSPSSLWLAYLLFDLQFILIEGVCETILSFNSLC